MKKMLFSFAVVSTLALSASAQLYDQTSGISLDGAISAYMTDNDTLAQCADDFTIPAGIVWDVTSVTVHGFRNNPGANMTQMTVEIYTDAAGPGTLVYSENITLSGAGVPSPQLDTAIVLTLAAGQLLSTGTYWLSVYGNSEAVSRWNWAGHGPAAVGATAMFIDTDDFFQAGATSWTPVLDLGLPDPDFAFQIGGIAGAAGISEISDEISIFPNPATDVLNIVIDTEVSNVVIYNVAGNVVLNEVNPSTQINIAELSAGAYVVEVSTINGISRTQIMKK